MKSLFTFIAMTLVFGQASAAELAKLNCIGEQLIYTDSGNFEPYDITRQQFQLAQVDKSTHLQLKQKTDLFVFEVEHIVKDNTVRTTIKDVKKDVEVTTTHTVVNGTAELVSLTSNGSVRTIAPPLVARIICK